MKKMVITGVNGFIGRHAKEYFEKEYEITGLDLAANYCGDRQPGDTMAYYQCNMSQESNDFCHRLVDHGRAVCTARTAPYCDRCCLNDICKKAGI